MWPFGYCHTPNAAVLSRSDTHRFFIIYIQTINGMIVLYDTSAPNVSGAYWRSQ
jgi:hypothetical protein